jgi:hypothetical protein
MQMQSIRDWNPGAFWMSAFAGMTAFLSLPDDELWAAIEKEARKLPGFKPRAVWAAQIEQRIAQATAQRRRTAATATA